MSSIQESAKYWNRNLPTSQHTDTCPIYLRDISQKDINTLCIAEGKYEPLKWEDIKRIVREGRLDAFSRRPGDLRRYLKFKREGCWEEFVRRGWGVGGFEGLNDWRVTWNDWPYGVEEGVVHLVVWTRSPFEEEVVVDEGGLERKVLTPRSREAIEEFLEKVFGEAIGMEQVLWFRNWSSLKSITAMEHFHVMLRTPDEEFVKRLTGGQVPLFRQTLEN